jgi:hypothetical protein
VSLRFLCCFFFNSCCLWAPLCGCCTSTSPHRAVALPRMPSRAYISAWTSPHWISFQLLRPFAPRGRRSRRPPRAPPVLPIGTPPGTDSNPNPLGSQPDSGSLAWLVPHRLCAQRHRMWSAAMGSRVPGTSRCNWGWIDCPHHPVGWGNPPGEPPGEPSRRRTDSRPLHHLFQLGGLSELQLRT